MAGGPKASPKVYSAVTCMLVLLVKGQKEWVKIIHGSSAAVARFPGPGVEGAQLKIQFSKYLLPLLFARP